MWYLRFVLFVLLLAEIGAAGFFMKRRMQNKALLESRIVNLGVVLLYCALCLAMAGLPSDPRVLAPPAFFVDPTVRVLYFVFGGALMALAAVFWVVAVRQRKAIGGEDVKEGLLTSGLYRLFRHPIYTSIIWMSLGLSLLVATWDGLLMVPVIGLANALEAYLEERLDVGIRFSAQYEAYRKRTWMFGPLWVWVSLAVVLAAVPLVVYLVP